MDSLEICKDSFVEKDLKHYYSDMLYRVNLGNSPGYIYFLFEHKSYPDGLVHLQLLEYMTRIWRLDMKQSKKRKLPVIIPLLLYHGPKRWHAKVNFSSVLAGPVGMLAEYIPDFSYVLYDLSRYSDEDIKGPILERVVLLTLKHIFDPNFKRKMPEIFSLLKEILNTENGLNCLKVLIKYIFSNVEDLTTEQFQTIVTGVLSKDKGEMVMTLAERLINQGRKQGLRQGIELGEEKGLKRGIELGEEKGHKQGLLEGIEFAVIIKFGDTNDSKLLMKKIGNIKDINRLKALKGKIRGALTPAELMKEIQN